MNILAPDDDMHIHVQLKLSQPQPENNEMDPENITLG